MGAVAVAALQRHLELQDSERAVVGSDWVRSGWVFTNEFGDYLSPTRVRTAMQRILTQAKLPMIRFHDLRHTAATVMLSRGVHPKAASEMLGHSTIAITLDLYSHVTENIQRQAAEAIDAAMLG
ncbi:MAG: tyrosine-type recombinase/integrase [Candidatus Dormibacteraeota bacterium]|nr:tyrosine-type recombinase/integrase [Candidatus Dormibacteraeota bacterium]